VTKSPVKCEDAVVFQYSGSYLFVLHPIQPVLSYGNFAYDVFILVFNLACVAVEKYSVASLTNAADRHHSCASVTSLRSTTFL
jgi:hypothetical protein